MGAKPYRYVAVFGALFTFLAPLPLFEAWGQGRGEHARCLSITDVNQRIECLEGRFTPPPMVAPAQVPDPRSGRSTPSFDCRAANNDIEYTLCAEPALAEMDARMGQLLRQGQ